MGGRNWKKATSCSSSSLEAFFELLSPTTTRTVDFDEEDDEDEEDEEEDPALGDFSSLSLALLARC